MLDIKEGTRPEQPPKVILSLAKSIASEKFPNPVPIKWRMSRKEDEGEGFVVVIFEHGPTLMFTEAQIKLTEFPAPIIHTKADAEDAVADLQPKPKRKEKPNGTHL